MLGLFLVLALPVPAEASRYVRYGVQDDAWLAEGPGSLSDRLAELKHLGADVYRFTLRWDQIAPQEPETAGDPNDPAYDWALADEVVQGLRANGIVPVLTIWGTPGWANGDQGPNVAPRSKWALASFARAAATRYTAEARHWVIWNEPNQRRWLNPASVRTYTQLLNKAYAAIKLANPAAVVAGGVTAPRGNVGGVNAVDWIRGMARHGATLDAYAHHPYPTQPGTETPWSGGCRWCKTITMADLDRLVQVVQRHFPRKRIWLTEYGYQTNPPEEFLGVAPALQALYASAASLKARQTPYVDMLIHFLMQDDARPAGWQSGLRTLSGRAKPAYKAFRLPLAQVSRKKLRTVVWGQVRPRVGEQPYRLQQWRNGRWRWIDKKARFTDNRGTFTRSVRAESGARLRIWSPRDRAYSPALVVR